MLTFPTEETKFLLKSPHGNIEVLASPRDTVKNSESTAIICHPHPLYGGTMTNKVVTILAKTFQGLGLNTMRFNFRGVGQSTGVHDEGMGETEDVLFLAEWVKKTCPKDSLWLAGFSFGGFVAANAAVTLSPQQLITIAPQVSRFVDHPLKKIPTPWLIVQGEADEIIDPHSVYTWVDTLDPQPHLIKIPQAGHFFHGQLNVLRTALQNALPLS